MISAVPLRRVAHLGEPSWNIPPLAITDHQTPSAQQGTVLRQRALCSRQN
jgi:hypothetical protein